MVGQPGGPAPADEEYRRMPLVLLQNALPSCNLSYLAAAFAVSWVVFFVYVFFVSRKQQDMSREITQLRETLEQSGAGAGD